MIPLGLFGILPIFVAAFVSFTDMDISGLARWSEVSFIGGQNYSLLVQDGEFWNALRNTFGYVVLGVPTIVVVSLTIALMLDRSDGRLARVLRSFYFVPAVTGIIAISLAWGYMYNTNFGLFNWILSLAGVGRVQWLSDPVVARISIGLVAVWRGLGLNTIIFLAALQSIPGEYREAAALDGASELRTTWSIVLPLMRFAIFFVSVTMTIGWLQFFDEAFVLTGGGPLGATTTMSIFLYQEGFQMSEFGYASAGSLVLFVIIAAITLVQFRVRRSDHG